jgi:putative membrane-bound dehydrogenase-like protein
VRAILVGICAILVGSVSPAAEPLPTVENFPPKSPQESLAAMVPRPGLRVELMAAEPLVMDPVDIAWGPDGKAWVVEMADYPLGEDGRGKPCGRVRFLEDANGDGVYDKSTLFLDGLNFPNGVMPWRKGVLVTCAPEVFYAEDTDGDGKADVRKPLFMGFGEGNQQHRVNHPRWGLDNWVHLANGDGGAGANGLITSVKRRDIQMDIRGRDLRVRPDEGLIDVVTGQAQYGRNRDDWGNWFGCHNNDPGWVYILDDAYIRRNPYVAAPPSRMSLTAERASFPVGWVVTHHALGQPCPPLAQPGAWTCLCGIVVYRDELLGPEFVGNTFVADAVYNCVHRKIVTPQGVLFHGDRAPDEQRSEFLCSKDPWFRPATIQTGPDGALWVVDMYRFVIEHPQWINDDLEQTLDLRLGHDRGRIYRVYPTNRQPRPILRLDKLDTIGLVAALDSPSGWQRDMAQQLLLWRADKSAAKPLEELAAKSPRPLARLHALCTLDGLGVLRPEVVRRGLADEHPGVRRHAVRLTELFLNDTGLQRAGPALGEALLRLSDDPDPQVQMQLAYTLGQWRDERTGRALGRLTLRHAADPYLLAAVMSSAVPHVGVMLAEVQAAQGDAKRQRDLTAKLRKLAADIKAAPNAVQEVAIRRRETAAALTEKVAGKVRSAAEVAQTLDQFRPALRLAGSPERGQKMFVEATCSVCHRLGDVGTEIGPDLTTLVDRSPQYLIVAVVDPNRAVVAKYLEYIAVTTDGRTASGMLLEETSNSITLVDAAGKTQVFLRKDLEELVCTGRSHMPERLEVKLNHQTMADLFAFIRAAKPVIRRPLHHKPELVEADAGGTLQLLAAQSEIHGAGITFDPHQRCLIWLAGRPGQQHAAWTVEVPQAATYEVSIETAQVPANAGNRFAIEAGESRVMGEFPSTGDWGRWERHVYGRLTLPAGRQRIVLRPDGPIKSELSDLRDVRLTLVATAKAASQPPPRPSPTAPKPLAENVPAAASGVLAPAPGGTFSLTPARGRGVGPTIKYLPERKSFRSFTAADHAAWTLAVPKTGKYEVWLQWSLPDELSGNPFVVEAGASRMAGVLPSSGGWDRWTLQRFGTVDLAAGQQALTLRPNGPVKKELCDLREIWLVPVLDRSQPFRLPTQQVAGNRPELVKPGTNGTLALLPETCEIRGAKINIDTQLRVIVWHFHRLDDHVAWRVEVPQGGKYDVFVEWAQIDDYADNPFAVEIADTPRRVTGKLPSTGDWHKYRKEKFGQLELASGVQRVVLRADGPIKEELSDIRQVILAPAGAPP